MNQSKYEQLFFVSWGEQIVYLDELEDRAFKLAGELELAHYAIKNLREEELPLQIHSRLLGLQGLVSYMKREVELYFTPESNETAKALQEGLEMYANKLDTKRVQP